MLGDILPRLGSWWQIDLDVLRCVVDRFIGLDRSELRSRLGAKELDLQFVRLVAGPETLDLQADPSLKADEPTGIVVGGVAPHLPVSVNFFFVIVSGG